MLISLSKQFIFVANTKTASTSIEKVLASHAEYQYTGKPKLKHMPARRAVHLYTEVLRASGGKEPQRPFKFGVMRDPFDWIGSWFRYRTGNRVRSPLPAQMTFEEFWVNRDWNIVRRDGTRFLQRDLFCGDNDDVLVDVIIPYEKLNSMFNEICDKLHIACALPRENVSRVKSFQIPPRLVNEVHDHFAPDLALRARLDEINEHGMCTLGV